jgi:Xaa-Pro dipeptidase
MFKSPAEVALLQKSNDLLLMAYRAPWATMRDGMPQGEFAGNCAAALNNLGVQGGIFCSFGKYTAFPHGSSTPQTLEEGDVVLMDGGCSVEGNNQTSHARSSSVNQPIVSAKSGIWKRSHKTQDSQPRKLARPVNPLTPLRGK